MKIIGYEQIVDEITNQPIGFLRCFLDNNLMIEFEIYSLFKFIEKTDEELEKFEKMFDDWHTFINELEEIGYDLISQLNIYFLHLPSDLVRESLYSHSEIE